MEFSGNKQNSVSKISLKNTFARIPLSERKPEHDANKVIERCQERLKTDKNYKQQDYDMDYIRLKVLKMTPPDLI